MTPRNVDGDTRARLLDAAEAEVAERGLEAVKVADVTARAGVGKGTFYLYFATKEEVIGAVQQRHYDKMMVFIAEHLGAVAQGTAPEDWWARTDALLQAMVDYDLEHLAWHRALGMAWSSVIDAEAADAQLIALVEAGIRAGIEAGACRAEDPELAARLLVGGVMCLLHHVCVHDDAPDRDRLVRGLQGFLHAALGRPGNVGGSTLDPRSSQPSTTGRAVPTGRIA